MIIDESLFWVALKIIVILLLMLYVVISFANYKQIKIINASLKTQISGLLNFLALLKVIGLIVLMVLLIFA